MCGLNLFQKTYRMAGHAAAITGKSKVFFRGSFHIDLTCRNMQGGRNILYHLRDVILQLRLLGNHGHIDIANQISCVFHLFPYNTEQFQRICAFIGSWATM